jgi:carbonic anhydrase
MKNAPHFAKNVFFGCIDDRLVESHLKFIIKLNGAFYPAVAGGGLAFVNPAEQATALKQVVASYKINGINNVYLESHTDCGAYRLSGAIFHSAVEELARLYADLDRAAELVHDALHQAGAGEDEVQVSVRVVDPAGTVQPRPQTQPARAK